MSRSYTPRPWEDKSGVDFIKNSSRRNGEVLRLHQNISHTAPESPLARLRDEWQARKPYYIILFSVGFVIVLAFSLFIRAALS